MAHIRRFGHHAEVRLGGSTHRVSNVAARIAELEHGYLCFVTPLQITYWVATLRK